MKTGDERSPRSLQTRTRLSEYTHRIETHGKRLHCATPVFSPNRSVHQNCRLSPCCIVRGSRSNGHTSENPIAPYERRLRIRSNVAHFVTNSP
ncbi:hypothetical protein TNCV_3903201 [Trichonephila clavipes]|nr:hypothetical protein TNCV_3903201 [Trichonephila clavipes]